jgi:hypothetical protein
MKKILAITAILMIGGFSLLAQASPPPRVDAHTGGGEPIGSGVVLLISLAAGYGGKKVFDFRTK